MPTKKSVRIEIVAFTGSPVTFLLPDEILSLVSYGKGLWREPRRISERGVCVKLGRIQLGGVNPIAVVDDKAVWLPSCNDFTELLECPVRGWDER